MGPLEHEAKDDQVPATPKVDRAGDDRLRFRASAFASPAGARPAALEWRVGRVGRTGWYELAEHWRKETDAAEVAVPAEVFKEAGEYRVRARWRDATGRCGHWSPPVTVMVK